MPKIDERHPGLVPIFESIWLSNIDTGIIDSVLNGSTFLIPKYRDSVPDWKSLISWDNGEININFTLTKIITKIIEKEPFVDVFRIWNADPNELTFYFECVFEFFREFLLPEYCRVFCGIGFDTIVFEREVVSVKAIFRNPVVTVIFHLIVFAHRLINFILFL